MSIRSKTAAMVLVTLLVLLGTLYAVLGGVMTAGFRRVEDEDARRNVARVKDAIESELVGIQRPLATWAQWDASYDFIQTQNPKFITENVSSALYTGMQVDFCVYVDSSFRHVFKGGYDRVKNVDMPVPPELLAKLGQGSVLLANLDPTSATRAIVRTDSLVLLVVAMPVTDTAAKAPAKGHVVFARLFDDAEVKQISATTHLTVSVTRSDDKVGSIDVLVQNEQLIRGSTVLADAFGRPAIRVSVDLPRAIYDQGQESLHAVAVSLGVIGLIFAIGVLLVIELVVLRRIVELNREVTGITESLDFTRQVSARGTDEISKLTVSINGLVCAVSEALSAAGANPK